MLFKVITTIAVTVAIFVLATQTPASNPQGESDGIAIPLTKRFDTDACKFHATSDNGKIIGGPSGMDCSERNAGTPHLSAVQRDGLGAGLQLTKYINGIWYAAILIGTPPRVFTVQLNTGFRQVFSDSTIPLSGLIRSSDLFVPASTGDENCRSHTHLWDPGASSQITNVDLNMDFLITFADGRAAKGKQYIDNVTIAGVTADSQTIGAAARYSPGMGAARFGPDGILGLGFPSTSLFHGQTPLLHTLFNEGKLPQPVFSLTLTETGGELYIGGTNIALYDRSTLVYTPVTYPYLWLLSIESIQINDKIVLSNVPAIIDTGANFIYGDPQQALALHRAGGGAPSSHGGGFYTFPCRAFPSVTFTIGRRPFKMPAGVLNLGPTARNSRSCFSTIANANVRHSDFWTLGTIFLQQFYTVFDFNDQSPRLGFAYLAQAS